MKHITIFSTKSAGSTALQEYFKINFGYQTVSYTEHKEEETLYWTKVASILRLKQEKMYRSVVPIPVEKAVDSLNLFFIKNGLEEITCSKNSTKEDFEFFYFKLIEKFGPRFIEKSPHHLFNNSNLKLIYGFQERFKNEINFYNIGLVRNPQAVLFSGWKRWRYFPGDFEKEWYVSYKNLLNWKKTLNIEILDYESMVNNPFVGNFILKENGKKNEFHFKASSTDKWKKSQYNHSLSLKTKKVAEKFGYEEFGKGINPFWLMELYWFSCLEWLKKNFKLLKKSRPNKIPRI